MASIAAPSMSCEANRPLTSHQERNQNQTRAENGPAFTVPACLLTVTGRCMRRCSYENGGGCTIRTHGLLHRAIFRLPFVKERRYYRIHHPGSQGQKIHPAVCGRQGVPLRRNEPAKNKIGTSPRRSQRNQLEFAAALASEDVSVGSMVAVILEWRRVSTTPK